MESFAAWAAAAVLYPMNTIKIRSQISGTSISTVNTTTGSILHSTYRGVIPFILVNALIGYTMRPLFSQAKLESIH